MNKTVILLSCLVVCLLAGCNNNVRSVGSVKFEDGSPLTEGCIYFVGNQQEFMSRIEPDGSFDIWGITKGDGLPPGQYNVYLTFPALLNPEAYPVEPKYTSQTESGWTVAVQPGKKNSFDFKVSHNLKRKADKPTTAPKNPPK
ncbi:MAG: hypothetical protein ACRCUY_11625 [Thermoguttaceae bacterium]